MEAGADDGNAGAGTDAGTELQLKVNTACKDGTAMFKVVNVGGRWPKAGIFAVYAIDGKKLISKRRMLLTGGQKASFKDKTFSCFCRTNSSTPAISPILTIYPSRFER